MPAFLKNQYIMKNTSNKIKVQKYFSTKDKQNLRTSYYFSAKFFKWKLNLLEIFLVFLLTRIPERQLLSAVMFVPLKATVEVKKQLACNKKKEKKCYLLCNGVSRLLYKSDQMTLPNILCLRYMHQFSLENLSALLLFCFLLKVLNKWLPSNLEKVVEYVI